MTPSYFLQSDLVDLLVRLGFTRQDAANPAVLLLQSPTRPDDAIYVPASASATIPDLIVHGHGTYLVAHGHITKSEFTSWFEQHRRSFAEEASKGA